MTCQFSGLVQAPTYKVAVLNEFFGLKHLNEMTRSFKCFYVIVSYIYVIVSYICVRVSYIYVIVSYIYVIVSYIYVIVSYIYGIVSYIYGIVSYIYVIVSYIYVIVSYIYVIVSYILLNEFSGLKHLNEMTRSYKCFLHVSNIHTIT
jgi:hypothetical protein